MARVAYCSLSDVTSRLSAGMGANLVTTYPDSARDALLSSLISQLSRQWDRGCGKVPEAFAPKYDMRVYSGRASQLLDIDEYARVVKIEYNSTPGRAPTWTDVTGEYTDGTQRIYSYPIDDVWPKRGLFRQVSFFADPYRAGNVRITGVFGYVEPDATAPTPPLDANGLVAVGNGTFTGMSSTTLATLQPVSPLTGLPVGWWVTNEFVTKTIARWVLHEYQATRAQYGDTAGAPVAGGSMFGKDVPSWVQAAMDEFRRSTLHLAMIGSDGTVIDEESQYGEGSYSPRTAARWSGWQTTT